MSINVHLEQSQWSLIVFNLKDTVDELYDLQKSWIDSDNPSSDELEDFIDKFEEVQSLLFEINNKLPDDD